MVGERDDVTEETDFSLSDLETRLSLEKEQRISAPIDALTLVVVGAHSAGKDTLLTELHTLSGSSGTMLDLVDYGTYHKVNYWTNRGYREGEALLREAGAIPKRKTDFFASGQTFVFWYRSGDTFYAFPPEVFAVDGIPMLHIADPDGLQTLNDNNTLPNKLTVFIRANTRSDLERRIARRLVVETKGKFPADFTLDRASSAEKALFDKTVNATLAINRTFSRNLDWYDAVFDNNEPQLNDIRHIFYSNARESLIHDTALRLNELFHRYRDACSRLSPPVERPSISSLHHSYVSDICRELFSALPKDLQVGQKLSGAVDRAVLEYANIPRLQADILYGYLQGVTINSIEFGKQGSEREGILTIRLKRQNPAGISLKRLSAAGQYALEHPDYHVLRILAYRILEETRTRPVYLVGEKNLIGLACSLTDSRPLDRRERECYRLEIRFSP